MAEANELYEAGQYAEAAAAYQAMVDAGADDGELYYNLGNAYYKSGDLGRAILNYRRAQLMLPRDSDVEANLELARDQTIDRLESGGDSFVDTIRHLVVGWTTLNEAAAITLGIWALLCMLVVAAILWPRGRRGIRYAIIVTVVLLLVGIISLGIRLSESHDDEAVVVAESVDVNSGPSDDYLTKFTLHSGAEIRVLEQRNKWARITLPGDLQGWMPSEAMERL